MKEGTRVRCIMSDHGAVDYGTTGVVAREATENVIYVQWEKLKASWGTNDYPLPMFLSALEKLPPLPPPPSPLKPKRKLAL